MPTMSVEYRTLPGTGASVGRAGNHALIADRPEGRALGSGLGFNGGQLLALALGGCFSNDLHYTAEKLGLVIESLKINVEVDLAGEPLVVTHARMKAEVKVQDGGNTSELMRVARANCTVANSLSAGVDVSIA